MTNDLRIPLDSSTDEIRRQFDALYGHSDDAVMVAWPYHPLEPVVACNEAFANIYGYTVNDLIGRPVFVLRFTKERHEEERRKAFEAGRPYTDEFDDQAETERQVALASGEPYTAQIIDVLRLHKAINGRESHVRKDGSIVEIQQSYQLITLAGTTLILHSTCEKTEDETEELPTDQEEFQKFLGRSLVPAFLTDLTDPELPLIDCNQAQALLLGVTRAELI
ncbi:MAG TPA: PAS domain-containing protein, partial [Abditibacteriaceae bacterium]